VDLPPWYQVVAPREDLRAGRPLDASRFAVQLEQVRSGRAPEDYVRPERFFERTYPTRSLRALAAEVLERLAGETVGAPAVYHLTTRFGGGKTHALTLLYHLGRGGPAAAGWRGVPEILRQAGLAAPPAAAVAVFVGQGFDPVAGRGGPGEPTRRTPWGEIAFQLGGEAALRHVAEHDRLGVAPDAGTLLRALPADRPVLVLMDEVMNYVARARAVPAGAGASHAATQFYAFLQNLIEAVLARPRAALLVALQASQMERTAEDEADYARLQKVLDRVARPVLLSEGTEIAEIVRRRLFAWGGLPPAGRQVAQAYAAWVRAHRRQLPEWFPAEAAEEAFAATYPLHPSVLTVFARKWQAVPRFQRTRGVLHLLALWIAHAYREGYRTRRPEPLLTLGSAPWEVPTFRSAVFEQLGEDRLEAAVTTDIAGDLGSHAVRLDAAAPEPIRSRGLHRQVATAVFFESHGGQAGGEASVAEVRLAVGAPDLEIGWVEQALDALRDTCYYLHVDGARYRFAVRPNLNKLLADRRAALDAEEVRRLAWERARAVFQAHKGVRGEVRVVLGPQGTGEVPDQPVLTCVVLPPERARDDPAARAFAERCVGECGGRSRTFQSALVFAVAEDGAALEEAARRCLAWRTLREEQDRLGLDEDQRRQLAEGLRSSERDLTEAVWRAYRCLWLLAKDGSLREIDLGLVPSSAAASLVALLVEELERRGEVTRRLGAGQLERNWPPALPEWSTRAVRDAVFASPRFPRLLDPEAIRASVADGVARGLFAYATSGPRGGVLRFEEALRPEEVEISDDAYLVPAEEARRRLAGGHNPRDGGREAATPVPPDVLEEAGGVGPETPAPPREPDRRVTGIAWEGVLRDPQGTWSLFYRRVLLRLAQSPGFAVRVAFEARDPHGFDPSVVAEVREALRAFGGDPRLEGPGGDASDGR
jgi:hypothetical protein